MQVIPETHIAALAARIAAQTALFANDSEASQARARVPGQATQVPSQLTQATAYRLVVKTAANWILQSISVRAMPDAPDSTLMASRQTSTLPLRALVQALKEVFVQSELKALLESAFRRLSVELPIVAERIALAHSLPPDNSLVAAWLAAPVVSRAEHRRKQSRTRDGDNEADGQENGAPEPDSEDPRQEDRTAAALVDLANWLDKAGYPDEYLCSGRVSPPPQRISEQA